MYLLSFIKAGRKLMLSKNSYTGAGLGLLVAGCLVSPAAYFILDLTWLTALGISMLIMSSILLALGKTIPKLPPEVCELLLETGIDNITAIVEELGIKTKAVYLPSSLTGNRPQALLPLHSNSVSPQITKAIPQRFITRYGENPDDIGLLISTIGSSAADLLELMPGPTPAELESSLTTLFTGVLGVADKAEVSCDDHQITVTIYNPRIDNHANWSHHCLGYPLSSMVASIAAEAWNKPVSITRQENGNKRKCLVELEVIN